MKSVFALLLVFGLVFHPAFLRAEEAADASAKKAMDTSLTADSAKGSDLDAGTDDWELGKDDLAAEDEDLKLDEDMDAKKEAAVPSAAESSAKPVQ